MPKHQKLGPRFAICIHSDDPDLLTPRMIYEILPDESAAKSNYLRVIDNEGEDYLYPAEYFVLIDLPREIELVLRASQSSTSSGLVMVGGAVAHPSG